MGRANADRSDQMRSIVDGWQSSGLSKQAYSRSHDISYKLFLYWYRKYYPVKRRPGTKAAASSFHELEIKQPVTAVKDRNGGVRAVLMELRLSDGRSLLFYEAADIDYLKAILY